MPTEQGERGYPRSAAESTRQWAVEVDAKLEINLFVTHTEEISVFII